MHDLFDSLEEVPESFFFNWLTLGKAYAADVWDYDIYAEIGAFQKPVLLLHGDKDKLVPVSYAERAAEVYPDAEYHVIEGAGHIFYGSAFDRACDYILQYLRKM